MNGIILKIAIILIAYIIFLIVMDIKYKNFIPEINYNIISIAIYCFIIMDAIDNFNDLINEPVILILVLIVIIATLLRKNKFYNFKGIDKKLIKEKENDILDIINQFKNSLEGESDITLANNRLVFEKVSKTQVHECLSLIGNYLDENRIKHAFKDYLHYYTKTIILPIIITIAAIYIVIKAINYEPPISITEQIKIVDEFVIGNNEGNINNYGLAAETDEAIYYAKDFMLYKSDKNLEKETLLVEQPVNNGKDTINVVDEWIFFREGKKIRRVRTDGTNIETIYNGYSMHMQVVGNWIYFISLSDDSKICKIDVNGQNKQFLSEKEEIDDMAVYNETIYYSYEDKENTYLESMNLNETGQQFISNIKTRSMIVDEDYIYYIDDVEDRLNRFDLENKTQEKLSNEQILKFVKDEKYIFYTIKDPDSSYWGFKGLYRMNVDGSNVVTLDGDNYLDEQGIGITENYIFYVSTEGKSHPSMKIVDKNGKSIIGGKVH
ncbi:MAG: hypothetical protein K0R07_831 [Sedimentibacter sp.]|jgi:hypothetical protein|nr:hypothetical protein [Sedimentibacter sp.]